MYLGDLQLKDIVSLDDGKNLGRIIDVEVDQDGKIINLIIEKKRILKKFFSSSGQLSIPFSNIKKIGDDVILINNWFLCYNYL